jgi:hypothetical protein
LRGGMAFFVRRGNGRGRYEAKGQQAIAAYALPGS